MYMLKLVIEIQKTIENNLKYPKGAYRTQTSEKKILRENSQQSRVMNFFDRKAPPPMLEYILNAPLHS